MSSKDNWEAKARAILTGSLSAKEMAAYREVLASEAFEEMLRDYHRQVLLDGAREVVLGLRSEQECSREELRLALVTRCLRILEKVHEAYSDDFVANWLRMPDVFCRVLLFYLVQHLQEGQVNTDHAPETRDLLKRFNQALLPALDLPTDTLRTAHYEGAQIAVDFYEKEARGLKDFKVMTGDYLEVWVHVLLQVYTLLFVEDDTSFLLLESNWDKVIAGLPKILELMALLKGYEELLLPENSAQLQQLLSSNPQLRV